MSQTHRLWDPIPPWDPMPPLSLESCEAFIQLLKISGPPHNTHVTGFLEGPDILKY